MERRIADRREEDRQTLFKWCCSNLVWIIGVLVATGALIYTVKNHDLLLDAQETKIVTLFKTSTELKINQATVSTKLDMIKEDLGDIKADLNFIKRSMPRTQNEPGTPTSIAKVSDPTVIR